jgi:hypothetical protein
MLCVPRRGTARRLELEMIAHLEGFTPGSIGHSLDSLTIKGRLVKVAPGLYRRPTEHEAKP